MNQLEENSCAGGRGSDWIFVFLFPFFFFFFQKLFDLLSAAFGGPLWQAYLLQEGR